METGVAIRVWIQAATRRIRREKWCALASLLIHSVLLLYLQVPLVYSRQAWKEEACSVQRPDHIVVDRLAGGALDWRERCEDVEIGRPSVDTSGQPASDSGRERAV